MQGKANFINNQLILTQIQACAIQGAQTEAKWTVQKKLWKIANWWSSLVFFSIKYYCICFFKPSPHCYNTCHSSHAQAQPSHHSNEAVALLHVCVGKNIDVITMVSTEKNYRRRGGIRGIQMQSEIWRQLVWTSSSWRAVTEKLRKVSE